jgi:hypothetical protein
MNDVPNDGPPPFPKELLNRPRPRAMVAGEKHLDAVAGATAVNHLLDLAATLQQRMSAAIGLIDAGEVAKARALLDAQVIALDALNLEPATH